MILTRSKAGYRAVELGPIFITKMHMRRWFLMMMQRVVGCDWTLAWASRRNWIESRDSERWFLKPDPPPFFKQAAGE